MIPSMTEPAEPIGRRDIAIAVALSTLGMLLMYANSTDHTVKASYFAIPVFLAVTIPVLWRRAAPLWALVAVLTALLLHIVLFGTVTRCGVVFPLVWVLAFSAGARLGRSQAIAGLGTGLAVVVAMMLADKSVDASGLLFFVPLTAIVWGIGRLAHSRRRLVAELRTRTDELRVARDDRARLEVASDRVRLSGELDELLQRRLKELTRLADAGGSSTDPASVTAMLAEIEHESRETLEEMREVVGVLRGDEDAPVAPQPTLASLEALLLNTKQGDARLTVAGSPRALPAGVELSAYRIVEHLLAAMDDAPGVEVCVSFADDALELTVAGPAGRRRNVSSSIERARERVKLHNGTLETTTRGGRSEVFAQLPVVAWA